MSFFEVEWKAYLLPASILGGVVIVVLIASGLIFRVLKRGAERSGSIVDNAFVAQARRPVFILLPLTAVLILLPLFQLPADLLEDVRHTVTLGMIASAAWLAINLTAVFDAYISSKFKIDVGDNLLARQVHTKTRVLRRIAVIAITTVAASAMIMTFPSLRHIGVSIFASAGVVGLIAGMAARPVLSNIIAGVQIAVTQPVRIDDVVVLEGEWGRIEEIGSTHVVVSLWDLRRLLVPLSYFIERPFENWTYKTSEIRGTVFLYTDYTVPVEEVRMEFHRLLQASEMWDGIAWSLQVTNATDRSLELRAFMSAPDSAAIWNLRCHVRENLIRFLQERYPQSLPKIRAEVREKPHGRDEGAEGGR